MSSNNTLQMGFGDPTTPTHPLSVLNCRTAVPKQWANSRTGRPSFLGLHPLFSESFPTLFQPTIVATWPTYLLPTKKFSLKTFQFVSRKYLPGVERHIGDTLLSNDTGDFSFTRAISLTPIAELKSGCEIILSTLMLVDDMSEKQRPNWPKVTFTSYGVSLIN